MQSAQSLQHAFIRVVGCPVELPGSTLGPYDIAVYVFIFDCDNAGLVAICHANLGSERVEIQILLSSMQVHMDFYQCQ